MKLTSVISLRDNYSAVMQRIDKNTKTFSRSVETVKKQLDAEAKKQRQIRMDTSPAMQAMKNLEKRTKSIRNAAVMFIAQTQRFNEKFDPITSKIKWATKAPFKVTFKMVDLASSGIFKLSGAIKSITSSIAKPLLIGGGLAAAGTTALIAQSLKGAALLEQQQISMSHFIGVNNPKKGAAWANAQAGGFLQSLRKNADLTPFGTDEVISTGTRAIGIASGNTKAAMSLLRLSEDMTALTPGKSLSDAIEALADLATGETERMKEFGFKISQAQVKAAGGDWSKLKNSSGISLTEMFRGGSDKLGTSASGLWSTITGTMKTGVTNMGVKTLNFLKPELQRWANYLSGGGANKLFDAGSNMMLSLFKSVVGGVHQAGEYLKKHFIDNPEFKKQTTFSSQVKFIFKDLKSSFDGWYEKEGKAQLSAVGSKIGGAIADALKNCEPIIDAAVSLGAGIGKGIWEGLQKIISEHPVLSVLLSGLSGAVLGSQFGPVGAVTGGVIGAVGGGAAVSSAKTQQTKLAQESLSAYEDGWIQKKYNLSPAALKKLKDSWSTDRTYYNYEQDFFNSVAPSIGMNPNKMKEAMTYFSQTQKEELLAKLNGAPKKAIGMRYVPNDNYPAILHQGERVLTAQENRSSSKGSRPIVININDPVVREEADFNRLLGLFRRELENADLNGGYYDQD